jgi:uncharacterized protein
MQQSGEKIWWYLTPFVLLMLASFFSPREPDPSFDDLPTRLEYGRHQLIYAATVSLLMLGAVAIVWRRVLEYHPPRISWLGIVVGVVGLVAWVLICQQQWESTLITWLGLDKILPTRAGFNPFRNFNSLGWMSLFLVARFTVLAIAVPIAEEWFLRGFLARYLDGGEQWNKVSFRDVSWTTLAIIVGFSVLSHPHEALAAIVWFSLINWLMKRTGNLWDCVAAHITTNFLLGVYILMFDEWRLW